MTKNVSLPKKGARFFTTSGTSKFSVFSEYLVTDFQLC